MWIFPLKIYINHLNSRQHLLNFYLTELFLMKKNIFKKVAMICSSFFTLMLVIGANSNSTMMMHQEKAPEEIKRFSKIR